MKKPDFANILTTLVILVYPLLIWYAHGKMEPRMLALALVAVAVLRLLTFRLGQRYRWMSLAALALAAPALLWNALLPLKLYPVIVSLGMLALFGASLVRPPSIIERLARLQDPDLPAFAVAYTRRVTQVWCGFFALNGGIAFATAVWASEAVWSLYTGLISYVLMGALFVGEYIVRFYVRRHHHA
ncbi:hypothetical protein [Herbaspirillum rhizosphaerae]|uniref:COG4648 family protein n=1 Tax=Herbaspirillum rhizosphaerae TaxID=346179 RepID=UPI00067B8E74|nr:hypothetical protein [Herbaspirillum rhizosphaerae]